MLRTVIQDSAISAAKSYSHAAVEPRHVLFACARQFRERPECEAWLAPAKRALEPKGSSYGTPTVGDEATKLLDTLKTDDDAIAALRTAFAASGDAPAAGGAGTQTAESAGQAPAEAAAPAARGGASGAGGAAPPGGGGGPKRGEGAGRARGGAAAPATAKPAETVADVLAELDALTGLGAVKAQVRKIIAVVQANTER